ncbi:MAG: nitrophenyl compound nitroreductase subunit ArsF family protein [Candidatus Kapaibacteriota bacterium]|jgi:hypothetical protein
MKKLLYFLILCVFSVCFTSGEEIKKTKIEVLYFHATIRCEACLMIEKFTKETIEQVFQDEIKTGNLQFVSLDFMQDENIKYVEEFAIETQTLIVRLSEDNRTIRWKNLDKIWNYLNDYSKFRQYIIDEIKEFLKEVDNGKDQN